MFTFIACLLVAFCACTLTALVAVLRENQNLKIAAAVALKKEYSMQERLLAAWDEGKSIPAADEPISTSVSDMILIPQLQGMVDDWETPAGKQAQLLEIRSRMLSGMSQSAVFRELTGAKLE